MSGKTFAQELAERCARWENEKARDSVVIRARHGCAILAAQTGWIRCHAGAELETVRAAIVGFVEAGIEEGRRWQSVSSEALAAAREEGRRAGWAEALEALRREAERRQGAYTLAAEAAERARGEWITTSVACDVLAAAGPEGER